MLFPGIKMPVTVLDATDLAVLKSKARNSGRDFGGAPLYDNTRIDPMDRDRRGNGRINYAADRPPMGVGYPPIPPPGVGIPPPGVTAANNPFAAFLDPNFAGKGMPGQARVPPPQPPPQYYGGYDSNQTRNQGGHGGYDGQRQGNGYGGQFSQNDNRSGGGSNGYYGGYGQSQQGGRRDDHQSSHQNQGYGGYYGGQGGNGRR
jgi:5'-3' exoribonuclease 2